MFALKRIPPALAGVVSVGLVAAPMAAKAEGVDRPGRVGAFRSSLGELAQGLSISLAQGFRYDSNLVRTENDIETMAIYGTDDASDEVSQTSLNVEYLFEGRRTQVRFGGDLSYAKYFNFDQFSGLTAGGSGSIDWKFTDRCSASIDARAERRTASLEDISVPTTNGDFQFEYLANGDLSCFIIGRLRASVGAFGDQVRNDEDSLKFLDVDYWGYTGSLAYVSPLHNEFGVRYRHAETTRPSDPSADNIKNDRLEGYLNYAVGDRVSVGLSLGGEREDRDTASDDNRVTGGADIGWQMTTRLHSHFYYTRATEDATDLAATTSQTDRFGADAEWKISKDYRIGGFASYEDNTLNAGPSGVLTGDNERLLTTGAYFVHPLFHRVNVQWNLGYTQRDADVATREFDSFTAGVSLGIGF